MKTLRAHGLAGKSLWDVTQATLIARILYAAPAWWGFLNAAEKDRIESVINKAQRYGYLPSIALKMYIVLWNLNSSIVFCLIRVMSCINYYLLKRILHNLRQRSHHLTLLFTDNNMIRKNFLHRMLFMDTY